MLIISYMSRLNSSQVTVLQQQPHYLQCRWRIPRRIGILKYENWVCCPPDDQYAPKKLQRDCVWLSHLKGFAYICDSLCNCLAALWNTSIWDCGELSRGESTAGVGGGARPRPPGGEARVPAALSHWWSSAAKADKPGKLTLSEEFLVRCGSPRPVWFTPTSSLGRSESKRTLQGQVFPGMTSWNTASVSASWRPLPGPHQGRTLAEAFCCDQLGSLWPSWEECQTTCVKLELELSHHDETVQWTKELHIPQRTSMAAGFQCFLLSLIVFPFTSGKTNK